MKLWYMHESSYLYSMYTGASYLYSMYTGADPGGGFGG